MIESGENGEPKLVYLVYLVYFVCLVVRTGKSPEEPERPDKSERRARSRGASVKIGLNAPNKSIVVPDPQSPLPVSSTTAHPGLTDRSSNNSPHSWRRIPRHRDFWKRELAKGMSSSVCLVSLVLAIPHVSLLHRTNEIDQINQRLFQMGSRALVGG